LIPRELTPRKITLPSPGDHPIVLITGGALRHLRFAYRIQQEFGQSVVGWYQVGGRRPGEGAGTRPTWMRRLALAAGDPLFAGMKWPDLKRYLSEHGVLTTARKAGKILFERLGPGAAFRRQRRMIAAERRIFGREIESIERGARLEPVVVDDPNDPDVVAAIRALRPYFLLTHGGPIYGKALLEVARGLAINQHSGWSPEFKGSNTTDWALYHRSLDHVGCTVHVPISAVDAGPILRRSRPCLVGDENPEAIFARVVALGTELMIDVVKEIIRDHEITVYDQPAHTGRTWLASELTGRILRSIERDYRDGWLREELQRVRSF